MALAYSTAIRNAMLDALVAAVGANGLIRLYDGSRPATGGTATTLLAELTAASVLGTVASGVLTLNPVTQDSSANATGTATWFRIVTSAGTFCIDGNVGTSGSDLNLNTTSVVSGAAVSLTSATITGGNA